MRQEILVNTEEEMHNQYEKHLLPMIELRQSQIAKSNLYLSKMETWFRAIAELIQEEKLPILTHHLVQNK